MSAQYLHLSPGCYYILPSSLLQNHFSRDWSIIRISHVPNFLYLGLLSTLKQKKIMRESLA